ncbi:nucleotidyl transferase AbiEii/AbiGii toxin family protein [Microbacterium sp.]|uniref:nucleotidyl transferase AbiEii/AbiGii toxin family protein n=1 Tax=Microbacterium sp. TaxID=51671 RepID=UPI002B9E069D|nr:nucleotidyl transferase AbiEii/AbiGii toxin family protein [Microbacterium sp.]HWK77337.1 nucleotidyl transferase AbiEii/AbiGii toxin family protein [Microbacterium sp.]
MATFGVGEDQVRRDHVISHALAALTRIDSDRLLFFGGTALARTHLTDLRLSEDIDLIALSPRPALARDVQDVLTSALGRVVGKPSFEPDILATRRAQSCVMRIGAVSIQLQLLAQAGYPRWPTEVRSLEQRYADAPPAEMRVLTAPAFAAAKLAAWHDRHAARDLYDLWALAARGLITDEARRLHARLGPTTNAGSIAFRPVPSSAEWNDALAHQGLVRVTAAEAAAIVADAWAS